MAHTSGRRTQETQETQDGATMQAIYEALGGRDGLRTAVSLLYRRLKEDPRLVRWFGGIDTERLEAHQRAFLTAAFGGPALFSGRTLEHAHEGMDIDDAAFERLVETLMTVLADLGVAKDAVAAAGERLEELRSQIVSSPS